MIAADPFPEMFREGGKWENRVRSLFENAGIDVEAPPKECRPEFKDRGAFGDDGDLYVTTPKGKRFPISVKSRTFAFTSPDDFPLRWVIVDTCKGWERCPAMAVVVISQRTGGIVVVPGRTTESWRRTKWKTIDGPKPAYECRLNLCKTWEELVSWIQSN